MRTDGWTLVEVPVDAWRLIDTLRRLSGRSSRSAVAEDLLRRALAVAAEEAAC